MLKIGFVLIFTFNCAFPAVAQTQKTLTENSGKIAKINSDAFGDKKTGIKELADGIDKLESEFKSEVEEIIALTKEIEERGKYLTQVGEVLKSCNVINCSKSPDLTPQNIEKKIKEYQKLQDENSLKRSSLKIRYQDRREKEIYPIIAKIRAALEKFRREKGYAAILDTAKTGAADSYMTVDETSVDVTDEFIRYYNENFEKTKQQ